MNTKSAVRIALVCVSFAVSLPIAKAASPGGHASDLECGPQSLLAVCQHFGVDARLDELAGLSGLDEKKGATMLGLTKAAEAKGLHALGMKVSIEELTKIGVPAIALLWDNHYVVAETDADGLAVTDYSNGTLAVPPDVFRTRYSGFALLIAKDEKSFPKSEVNGPDLRFDTYDYDFAFIEQGAQTGHTFAYENRGNQELVISKAETSCSCTQAFLPKEQRIPPGGKGELVVGYDSTGREGGQSQTVYVYSNDPISPVVQLQINGVIKPVRLPVSTRNLDFGTVKKRDGATREFSIKDPGDDSLTVKQVTSDTRSVKVSLTRSPDKQGTTYLVKAVLSPGAPIGVLKGAIKVSSNHPKEPVVEIPVAADVIGDTDIFPHQIFLGLLKKGQSASKKLTLSTTSDEPLTIEKIDNPCDYVIVTASPEVGGKKYTITATLKGTAPVGLIKQVVVVHTTDPDQPEIKIPLYALIQD